MDRLAKLVAAVSVAIAGLAAPSLSHAGYAQLAPPAGWSAGGGSGGSMNVPTAAAANGGSYSGGNVRTNPGLGVGGRMASIPASSRMAANAGRFAAAAAFAHPGLRAAAAIAGWVGLAGMVWDAVNNRWAKPDSSQPAEDGLEYTGRQGLTGPYYPTKEEACATFSVNGASARIENGRCNIYSANGNFWYEGPLQSRPKSQQGCPTGWYYTPAGCSQTRPLRAVPEQEFVDGVSGNPMPEAVPPVLPHPLPVELPDIQPMFVPTGNPVPNPDHNPNAQPSPENQPWLQPGVRVTPAPTPQSPWQVDVQPVNRPVDSPTPNPNPVPLPSPGTPTGDKPRAADETPDLCEKHPDILACQKLDTPQDQDLQTKQKDISITPDSGWGSEDASCPAPRVIYAQGRRIPIPFDLFCTYMQGLRPIIIAMAWLSAAFILVGAREASA